MTTQPERIEIKFDQNKIASGIEIHDKTELGAALAQLGLIEPRPTLVVVGGAARLSREILFHLEQSFVGCLAPLAERFKMYVVDGGTDAGVMQMMGDAREKIRGTFPLIGVPATGTVIFPGKPKPGENAWHLEPHHSHFVFVPGSNWGDEVDWIARTASVLSGTQSSVTVLVNGGEIAYKDVGASIKAGRGVVIAQGSGRTADVLASALHGKAMDARASALVRSGLLRAVDLEHGPAEFTRVLEEVLSTKK